MYSQTSKRNACYFYAKKIKQKKENKKMAVIIKLNGNYIGETTMTTMTASEIKNAQSEGFTVVLRKGE